MKTPNRIAVLIALLYVVLALATSNSLPPFESADEAPHFLVSHHLLTERSLPTIPSRADVTAAAGRGDVIAQWAIESHQPPLYYAIGALLMMPTQRTDLTDYLRPNELIFTRGIPADNANVWLHDPNPPRGDTHIALTIGRLYSLVLSTLTLWLIYRAAMLATDSPLIALTAMLTVAGLHTFQSIGSSYNNDNLVTLLYTAGVVVTLHMWRARSIRPREIVLLSVILSAIALTKITGGSLFAVVYGALLLGALRRRFTVRAALTAIIVTGLVALALAGWWYLRNWSLYGDPLATKATQSLWGREFARAEESGSVFGEISRVWRSFWFMTGHLHQPVYGATWYYVYVTAAAALGVVGWLIPRRPKIDRDVLLILGVAGALPVALLAVGTLSIDISYGRLLFPALVGVIPLLAAGWKRTAGRFAPLLTVPLYVMAVIGFTQTLPDAYPRPQVVAALPPQAVPVNVQSGGLTLVGYERLTDSADSGESVRFNLYLSGSNRQNPALFAALIDAVTLENRGDTAVFPATMPTDSLAPDVIYRVPLRITLDSQAQALPPSLLRLQLGWQTMTDTDYLPQTLSSGESLEVLLVDGTTFVDWGYDAPTPQTRTDAVFGRSIALDGASFSAQQVRAGENVDLTLLWRYLLPMDADYVATVQMLDANGQLITQRDGDVTGYPTSQWRAAPPFADSRTLSIPPGTPAGTYRVWVGWYRLPDAARLPAIGTDVINDLYPLPLTVEVIE